MPVWLQILIGVIFLLFGFVAFFGAPYVPSRRRYIKPAFDSLYKITNKDLLVDLGSGDGIVLRIASQRGARAVGYELNPVLVLVARWLSRKDKMVKIYWRNFFKSKLPENTTVLYVFAVDRDGQKISQYIQSEANRLERKLMVISYGLRLPHIKHLKNLDGYSLGEVEPLQLK